MGAELNDLSIENPDSSEIKVPIENHNLSQYHQKREEFNLAEALLNLTKSPDQKIAVKACEVTGYIIIIIYQLYFYYSAMYGKY